MRFFSSFSFWCMSSGFCTGSRFRFIMDQMTSMAYTLEVHVLLSALLHIFVGLMKTIGQMWSSVLMSGPLFLAIGWLILFQFRFADPGSVLTGLPCAASVWSLSLSTWTVLGTCLETISPRLYFWTFIAGVHGIASVGVLVRSPCGGGRFWCATPSTLEL